MHSFSGKSNRASRVRAFKNLRAQASDKVRIALYYK